MAEPLRERFRSALASVERGRGLGAACYRDPEFFALEVERVLRPGWHAVARWDSLPAPGDYACLDLFGEPLIVVRDREERLRVLSNVCRHRAHTVAEGTGNTRRFVCPYHRWSYGLDGSLKTAPLMDGVKDFDPALCGLPELATETWQGFVFASLEAGAAPLAAQLGGLDETFAPLHLEALREVAILDFDSPWNWKVMVDNFMESYHHLGTHEDTLQAIHPAKNTYSVDRPGLFGLLANPGQGSPDLWVAQVFPTWLLAVTESPVVAAWYELQIDRHDHFDLRIHVLAPEELAEDEAVVKLICQRFNEIHVQDIEVCQRVQRGMASQLWEPGPLSEQEGALTRFHRYLAERIAS